MPIEQVGKKEIKPQISGLPLDDQAFVDALQKRSIKDLWKIMQDYGLTVADFEQFAKEQYGRWTNLLQPEPVYESYATIQSPDIEADFLPYESSNALTEEDKRLLTDTFTGKAMVAGKAGGKAGGEGEGAGTGLLESAQAHLDEWNSFYNNVLEPKIVEIQFQQQLQTKTDELARELEKIVAMIRSGQIEDPAILILALTKVNVERNGLIFTQLGQRVWRVNEQMSSAFEMLKGDPSVAAMYTAQQDIKTSSQSMQFLIGDMQKVTQHIESAIMWAKSSMDAIKTAKDEIIRRIAAQG